MSSILSRYASAITSGRWVAPTGQRPIDHFSATISQPFPVHQPNQCPVGDCPVLVWDGRFICRYHWRQYAK